MKTRSRIAATITGGAAAVALFAATPSIAANGPTAAPQPKPATSTNQQQNAQQQNTQQRNIEPQNTKPVGECDGTGTRQGNGPRNGQGNGQGNGPGNGQGAGMQRQGAGMGAGMGTGTCDLTTVAKGTLTEPQKEKLVAMAEEEKLAQDLYVAFGVDYGAPFSRITNAETQHLTAVRTLMTRYSVTDPTSRLAAGTFASPETQKTYDKLLALGDTEDGARKAARTVESTDIRDLKAAAVGVTAPDVKQVYANLLAASERHLVAFGG